MWSRRTSSVDHVACLHPGDAVVERDPGAGDRSGAGSAVGLDDVAVDGDLTLAERLEIDHRAQAAADQALDFDRAAVLLAGRRLAPRALERRARQHAVFGGDPAARLALEPGRQAVLQRRGDQHMRVAEPHEARAFRVFHHAALERDRAAIHRAVGGSAACKSPWTLAGRRCGADSSARFSQSFGAPVASDGRGGRNPTGNPGARPHCLGSRVAR